jgi:hypothetical protein
MLDGQASFDSRGLPFFFYNCPENGARGQIASVPGERLRALSGLFEKRPRFRRKRQASGTDRSSAADGKHYIVRVFGVSIEAARDSRRCRGLAAEFSY